MKKLFIIFTVTLLILFTASCDKGKLLGEYYFTEEMYKQIPFEGNETLSFIDAGSNSIVLLGGERKSEIHKVTECNNCSRNDYYYFESSSIKFSNDSYEISLSIGARPTNIFIIGFVIAEIPFTCTFDDNLPLSKEKLYGNQIYYDSIIINNSSYYNVFGDTLTHTGIIPINPYPVFCYYSTEYGVIKMDFSDDSYWALKDIVW